MRTLIFIWALSSSYTTQSSLFCEQILDNNQLSTTGLVIDLNKPTALNGVITVKTEHQPHQGVLELLIEPEEEDNGRDELKGREEYDALIRVELSRNEVHVSSRVGQELLGQVTLQMRADVTQNSSLTLQLLARWVMGIVWVNIFSCSPSAKFRVPDPLNSFKVHAYLTFAIQAKHVCARIRISNNLFSDKPRMNSSLTNFS